MFRRKHRELFLFRNAFYNSGEVTEQDDHFTRLMRRGGEVVEWDAIRRLDRQSTSGWKVYQLTQEAVELNNFSKMRVNLMEKVRLV